MKKIVIMYVGYPYNIGQVNYILADLETFTENIYVYIEEQLDESLLKYNNKVHIRKGVYANRMNAYAQACKELSKDNQMNCSIVFCDNSFFGPFISVSEMIEKMKRKNSYMWTISRVTDSYSADFYIVYGGLDFSFFNIDEKMDKVVSYFSCLNDINIEDLKKLEVDLTCFLRNENIKVDTYIDYYELESTSILNNMDWMVRLPYFMLNNGSPILKKECFVENDLRYGNTKELFNAIQYVKECTTYDENIIWDYLLSNFNITDIIDNLQLRYVIDENAELESGIDMSRSAIIMHITYEKVIDQCFKYILSIPEEIPVFITSKGNSCIKKIEDKIKQYRKENCKLLVACERGRDVSALLITCREILQKYEYICFVHDNKTRNNLGPAIIGENNMWDRWDNTIKSASYIRNVHRLFRDNQRLGIVIPPVLHYGGTFTALSMSWAASYMQTKMLAERIQLNVDISEKKYNYSLGTTFWCRTAALKKLFDEAFELDDFCEEPMPADGTISHGIERILLYVAQDAGYYPAIIECSEYASRHIGDLNNIMRQMIEEIEYPVSGYYKTYIKNMNLAKLEKFVKKHKKIYIYGNGYIARKIGQIFEERNWKYESYVISDNKEINCEERSVIHFSDMSGINQDIGIVVGLSGYYQREVVPRLLESGYTNLFIV